MNKSDFLHFGKKVIFSAGKHAPQALTGMSAGGTAAGIFLAVKAGMEFQKLRDSGEEITWKDYIRIFGPAAAAGVFSIACAFAGLSKMEQRYAAAALLANTYEMTHKEFDEKAHEIFGDGKTEKLHDEVNKEVTKKNPLSEADVMMVGEGNYVWFYDKFTHQKTLSTMEKIDAAVNDLNVEISQDYDITYMDYSDRLGFEEVEATEEYVWSLNKTGIISLRKTWDSYDGRTPVCILEHKNPPKLRYDLDTLYETRSHLPGWSEV